MALSMKKLASCFSLVAALGFGSAAVMSGEPAQASESTSDQAMTTANMSSTRAPEDIVKIDGSRISKQDMVDELAQKRVIYISETHDNLMAHAVQAELIEMLEQKYPGKVVVAMEMFRDSHQPYLDQWHQGKMSDEDFTKMFHGTWGFDPEIYKAVLQTIFKNDIPVIGLRPSAALEKAFDKRDPNVDYPDMDQNDSVHRWYNMQALQALAGAHGHASSNSKVLERYYQKQLLRDEAMGEVVAEFLDDPANDDKILVVIAGTQHIQYGLGIPKRADRRHHHDYAIVLASVNDMTGEIDRVAKGIVPQLAPAGDYIWSVDYLKLEDALKMAQKKPDPSKPKP